MKKRSWKAFTLIEMLVVLFVIGILVLLFIPNIHGVKQTANKTGGDAIIQVVKTQQEIYAEEHGLKELPTVEKLVAEGYLTDKQKEAYETASK